MLSDREKVVVGTCLLVILAAVVTGCLVLFAGGGKAPSGTGQMPNSSGPQALLNGQAAAGQTGGSLPGLGSPEQQAALQQQQAFLEQQAAAASQQSNSSTQDQQSAPSGATVAGSWLLDVKGKVYNFPSQPVTLKQDGTVSLGGANSPYVNIRDSRYSFNAANRSIQINCTCEITIPQSGSMPVTLTLNGTFDPGLTKATGVFMAATNSTPTDQGTFTLHH